jgi:hypothetical protein
LNARSPEAPKNTKASDLAGSISPPAGIEFGNSPIVVDADSFAQV